MVHFFLLVYRFLGKQKPLLYCLLCLLTGLFAYQALQIRFVEDINSFMPKMKDSENINAVFKNNKVKDKIVLLFSAGNKDKPVDPDDLVAASEAFLDSLLASGAGQTHIRSVLSKADESFTGKAYDYVTENLPAFMDSIGYVRLDSLLLPENLTNRLRENYRNLISPLSLVSKKYIFSDPLGLCANTLNHFNDLQLSLQYEIYDDHIFSADHKYLIAFISPVFGAGEISNNEALVNAIESQIDRFSQIYPNVKVSYFGGIPVGIYNARQIKNDSLVSMLITLVLISALVLFAFRRKSAIPLILLPAVFGGLFALALMSLIYGTISTIAIGAGSIILGVTLSYSIHVFCHSLHAKSGAQIIRELAYPMTVGSFTTIGAFAGLSFASSDILHDFGLFSCFTLIGSTIFCLVFLPHFLVFKPQKQSAFMRGIERINAYPFEKNKYLPLGITLLTLLCLFFFNRVKFNPDMNSLTFMPDAFSESENVLNNVFQGEYKTVYFVSVGDTPDETFSNYSLLNGQLDSLKAAGLVKESSSAANLWISPSERERKIEQWKHYWTPDKKASLKQNLIEAGKKQGFKEEAFSAFFAILDKDYSQKKFAGNSLPENDLLADWIDMSGELPMAMTQVRISEKDKEAVYQYFANSDRLVILDKPYFASKMADVIHTDFNTILYIVSILVFLSILISYGRIEITLISFLPMAISWIIILGLMALFGIEFNIINIIISTFIFGIGDDFSIFITDGLLSEYKTGKKILNSHKTAIFFSTFTVVAGLGALSFSKHPALYSVSLTGMIGMLSVILVSYTVQPFIFRLFISGRTVKGKFPYTAGSMLATGIILGIFALGSIILTFLSYLFIVIPISEKKKKRFFHALIHYLARFLLRVAKNEKTVFANPFGEDFSKSGIIIANHQSVIDILQILALHKKIIMVTKAWVVRSPLFGRLARYADFVDISINGLAPETEGRTNDLIRRQIGHYLQTGYSIAIFPEGSRSADCKIKRFHKGAFFLAGLFKTDIIPVLLHGQGQIITKNDPFYVKNGMLGCKILQRIAYEDLQKRGQSYQIQCKTIAGIFRREHALFIAETDAINPYYRYKLIKNYIYKGPVLEWYTRIKTRMEKDYLLFENLIPKTACICDLGCGYGYLDYMLAFRSDLRTITGIDYDEDKIDTARHNFSNTGRLKFIHADVSKITLEDADVFVLNDFLHYLQKNEQNRILQQCFGKLNPKGRIIIRDGDREKIGKHKLTQLSEVFSTRILGFNKKEHDLCFLSTEEITIFASQNGLSLRMTENDKYSSNTIYILEKQ
ncbi:MAG: methyltransferase domain-containing protein [Candidatus Symbiothrix sp.]|jgi:1-acyl-sn-glycerol-3-phosphate acyltransferase|nr:methyltransferase domain-containing protein [Candidatus Symbiothrix sp.]